LRVGDETAQSVDGLVADLRRAAVPVFVAGGAAGDLSWLGDDHPVTDAILLLVPAYRAIEVAARALGYDPDKPPHLSKVTKTL
jgi:glucosamine--fructose-6-phosphate aminotransferase (isomerizing)